MKYVYNDDKVTLFVADLSEQDVLELSQKSSNVFVFDSIDEAYQCSTDHGNPVNSIYGVEEFLFEKNGVIFIQDGSTGEEELNLNYWTGEERETTYSSLVQAILTYEPFDF